MNALKYDVPDPPLDTFRRKQPWVETCCPFLNIDNYSIKFDQVVSNKHKISASFVDNDRLWLRYGNGPHLPGPIPNAPMAGDAVRPLPGKIVRFAEDWTISPTIVNHLGYGYNRLQTGWMGSSYPSGEDWARLISRR